MKAIDTNLVVRLLMDDDPQQSRRATRHVAQHGGMVLTTVLIETAWVLGSVMGLPATQVAAGFRILAGNPNIEIEEPERLAYALELIDQGLGVADALHVAGAEKGGGLATFDRRLIRAAERLSAGPVSEPA